MPSNDLNPSVQTTLDRLLGIQESVVEDRQIDIIVNEDDSLAPVHELAPNLFLVLTEDESGYDLVELPITEGVGDLLAKGMRGLSGMWKWLYNNATDWLSRKLPGGTARQITKLYNEDPKRARQLAQEGLSKQFQGPELDEQMRIFDAKMSRQKSLRTNGLNMLARARKDPKDQQAVNGLQAIGDAYGASQKEQEEGADPIKAMKKALQHVARVAGGGMIGAGGGSAGGGHGHAPTEAKGATPAVAQHPAAAPAQQDQDVHQIDANTGEVKTGKLQTLNDPKQGIKDLKVVLLPDGTSVPFNDTWKAGPPPQQPTPVQKPAQGQSQPVSQPNPAQPTSAAQPSPTAPAGQQTPAQAPSRPASQPAAGPAATANAQQPQPPPIPPRKAPPAKAGPRQVNLNNRRKYSVTVYGTPVAQPAPQTPAQPPASP